MATSMICIAGGTLLLLIFICAGAESWFTVSSLSRSRQPKHRRTSSGRRRCSAGGVGRKHLRKHPRRSPSYSLKCQKQAGWKQELSICVCEAKKTRANVYLYRTPHSYSGLLSFLPSLSSQLAVMSSCRSSYSHCMFFNHFPFLYFVDVLYVNALFVAVSLSISFHSTFLFFASGHWRMCSSPRFVVLSSAGATLVFFLFILLGSYPLA